VAQVSRGLKLPQIRGVMIRNPGTIIVVGEAVTYCTLENI
jgi:hypothetical protein